jgi:hypothetical protein
MRFASRLIYLKGELIDFEGRPYLPAIYASKARNLVVRASRQVEKTTFLAISILHAAVMHPGIRMLYVCPRMEQARVFARTRLQPILASSPILSQYLAGGRPYRLPVMNLQFANGSSLYVRAAYRSADAVRGISADILLVDECQDVAAGDLPVLRETLSHSTIGRTILCGTPKLVDNHLEGMFNQSTANEWQVPCSGCRHDAILDERCIGPTGIMCPNCGTLLDKRCGLWVPRNPNATWGDGFWINALMVPWKNNHDEILECQRTYDVARFRNEVLGLPVSLGEHIVTREQLEACCANVPMARTVEDVPLQFRKHIIAGVDWGAGGAARTAVVVGYLRPEGIFDVCHFARIGGREDPEFVKRSVIQICRDFRVRWIAADVLGNGSVYNRLLLDEIGDNADLYALLYSAIGSEPYEDGILWKWPIGRTNSIGYLFSNIKTQRIQFPRVNDCGTFLDEFAAEVAEYDDKNRCIKFSHAKTQPDDILHATNYALKFATRGRSLFAQDDD